MPTYDYQCLECGKNFDVFQKMSDELLKECPDCKGKVNRLIGSGSGLIFKGSGFYATDYKRSPAKAKEAPCEAAKEGSCPNHMSCPKAKDIL